MTEFKKKIIIKNLSWKAYVKAKKTNTQKEQVLETPGEREKNKIHKIAARAVN